MVAWYTSSETSQQNAGWVKTIPTQWKNKSADEVTIPIVKPLRNTKGLNVDHYEVYYQNAADFTYGSDCYTADSVAESGETATSVNLVVTGLTGSGTITGGFASSATSISTYDGLIVDMKGTPRVNVSKASDGTINRKSYANDVTFETLELLFTTTTVEQASWQTMLGWMKYGTPLKLVDNSADTFISTYYGQLVGMGDPGTIGKNLSIDFPVQFLVEYETES